MGRVGQDAEAETKRRHESRPTHPSTPQTPARYAVSKLASNTAFFVKGARMAVKSVADRVAARAAPRPAKTSKPAGDMQDIDDTARAKYDAMLRDEADARQETGHDEPLTSAYPEAGAAARATAGVDQDKKEE